MMPMTLQILLPCYFGNEMMVASEKLSTSLFHSDWINKSDAFKKAMKIFMENAKRPLKLSSFGVFDLTLDNFLKVINSTYSLYAVMKNVAN